jgi:hypothetical protein
MQDRGWLETLFGKIDDMDTEGFLFFLTPDARFRFGNMPVVHGREAIGKAVQAFFSTIKRSDHRLFNTWVERDAVICQGEVTYTRRDYSQVTLPFVNVFRVVDAQIDQYLIYVDITPLYRPVAC